MAKISIIIPIYNTKEEYFRACIQSVLRQTFADFEVFLADDGSTNGIESTCDEYAALDSRIRVLHLENGGVSAARNAGLRAANGEWVIFIDSDDWWEPDILEASYNKAVAENLDVLLFGLCYNDGHTQTVKSCVYRGAETSESKIIENIRLGLMDKHILSVPSITGSACTELIRMKLIRENGIHFAESLVIGEDIYFNLVLWCKTDRIGLLNKTGYHYVRYETASSRKHQAEWARIYDKTNLAILKFLTDEKKGKEYFYAYEAWLMAAYIGVVQQDIMHPDNPKTYAQRKAEWKAIPQKYSSFAYMAQMPLHVLWHERKRYIPLYFAAFWIKSLWLTNLIMEFNHKKKMKQELRSKQ